MAQEQNWLLPTITLTRSESKNIRKLRSLVAEWWRMAWKWTCTLALGTTSWSAAMRDWALHAHDLEKQQNKTATRNPSAKRRQKGNDSSRGTPGALLAMWVRNAGDRDFSAQNSELDGKIQHGKSNPWPRVCSRTDRTYSAGRGPCRAACAGNQSRRPSKKNKKSPARIETVVARLLTDWAKPKANKIGLHLPHSHRTGGKLPGPRTHARELNWDETLDSYVHEKKNSDIRVAKTKCKSDFFYWNRTRFNYRGHRPHSII
jgi:hypothetical protein